MKKRSITLSLLIVLLVSRHVLPQSMEITKEFKDIAAAVAKEEFRNYLFRKLENTDPCMAIVSYDLLAEIIDGKDYQEIIDMFVDSSVDYFFLNQIKTQIDGLLVEKERNQTTFETRKGFKVDISTKNRIERDFFLSISALYWYAKQRENLNMRVSLQLSDLLIKFKNRYDFRIIYKYDIKKSTEIWTKQILRSFVKETFEKSVDVRLAEFVKRTLSELMHKKDGWEDRIVSFHLQLCREYQESKGKGDMISFLVSTSPARIDFVIEGLRNYFSSLTKEIENKIKLEVDNLNPNMVFSIIYPYLGNLINQRSAFYYKINEEQIINDVFDLLNRVESKFLIEQPFSVKLGLWVGTFFNGPNWYDRNGNIMEYPIYSFKINDRFQYSFWRKEKSKLFFYLGGLTDILFNDLLNKNKKSFIYAGLGYEYKQVALCFSAAISRDLDENENIGTVFSVMYDINFSNILKSLRKK